MLHSTYNPETPNTTAEASALDRLDRVIRELFQATPLHVFSTAVRAALRKPVR